MPSASPHESNGWWPGNESRAIYSYRKSGEPWHESKPANNWESWRERRSSAWARGDRQSQSCDECGSLKENDAGWQAPNGQYYCTSCWSQWHSMPPPAPRASGDWGSASKRSKKFLCNFMGIGCSCCGPVKPSDAIEVTDDDSWKSLFKEPDLPELCGLGFSDAHCHLDVVLQNNKHGGIGWTAKHKLCKWWMDGYCPYGTTCDFAHGRDKIKPRVPLERHDIEPYLQHYAGKRTAGNKRSDVNQDSNTEGPILQCVVTNCCEVDAIEDTKRILALADAMGLGTVFCSFGCHPHDYRDWTDEVEERFLAELDACGSRVVAWGECGLDYCKNHSESLKPDERQRMLDVFARQARIAVERKLPLVVHSRDAESDTLQVLKECLPWDHKFHIHAYQGDVSMMTEALRLFPKCVFGVSSMVWCSQGALQVAKQCPLERLVLETDAPYLAGGPHAIPSLAVKVAELKGLSAATVMETTSAVCRSFYGIQYPLK